MGDILTVSTDGVEPRHRVEFWSSMVASTYAPFEIIASPLAEFQGRFTATSVDDMLLSQTEFAPSGASRPNHMLRSAHFDGFMFVIPKKGVIEYGDDATRSVASPGDIAFYDYSRSFRFDMGHGSVAQNGEPPASIESINITVSREALTRLLGPAARGAGLVIGADQPSNLIVRSFFGALIERAHDLDPATASRMAAIGLDLLAAGLAERLSCEPAQSVGGASLAYRAKTFIKSRLWDNELDVATIAAAVNLSVRRLHKVFAEQDLTVDGFVWEHRLRKAYRQLRDPAFDRMSIGEICYGVGFVSISHFTRRFRQRFVLTPTDCRRRARLDRMHGAGQAGARGVGADARTSD